MTADPPTEGATPVGVPVPVPVAVQVPVQVPVGVRGRVTRERDEPTGPSEPILAVGAVVRDAGCLLLIRRGRAPHAGKWSLPGGRVEPGETLPEAVAREVAEETGLEVEPKDLIGWVERQDGPYHFVILDFAATISGPGRDLVAGDDAAEAAWIPLERVPRLDLVPGLLDWLVDHGVVGRPIAGVPDGV